MPRPAKAGEISGLIPDPEGEEEQPDNDAGTPKPWIRQARYRMKSAFAKLKVSFREIAKSAFPSPLTSP